MADVKKFLDQSGVSALWTRVAAKVAEEEARAKLAEQANAAAAAVAKKAADDVTAYVGTIPATYTESNIVAYIQKVASETLTAASGNSTETAASVKQQLDEYKLANDLKVQDNTDDIAAIVADYLKAADKTELADDIAANASEILRIDNALKAAVENDGEGLDSIKELATWIEAHGTEAAGYAAAIDALELLVGDKKVADAIADAIAAENLAQYAKAADLTAANGRIDGLVAKVDTGDKTVSAYVADAIAALSIGDYAKAADLTALAARVSTLETKVADLEAADILLDGRIAVMEGKVSKWDAAESNAKAYADSLAGNYDAAGAAATAESNAKAYTDSEITRRVVALTTAEIEAAIAAAQA